MKEPILVTQSSIPDFEEYTAEISTIWGNHWLTNMGEKHRKLEEELKNYLDVERIILFSNGHMALELLLQAFDLSGEVITTPFTFASTTHAIVRNNLKPVFCDINPVDFTMDANKIEDLITDRTTAIVPVHVYGRICNVEEIERIARKHGLKVIYDAAHAFGETYKGIGVGNFGDASMFSFHATKVFNTIEGGGAVVHDDTMKKRLNLLKNFGIADEDHVDLVGANSKMNEFQAAMGICNLRHIDEEIGKRKCIDERYRERLKDIDGLYYPAIQAGEESNYAYFPVVIDEEVYGAGRDQILGRLKENNIFGRKYFYPLTSSFSCYKGILDPGSTPVADRVSKQVMTVPMFADLKSEDVDRICDIIISCKQ